MKSVHVLSNLKNYASWDYQKYPLSKEEADVIIPLLERDTPKEPIIEYDDDGNDEEGRPIVRRLSLCPSCHKNNWGGEFFCSACGQRLR